MRCRLAPLAARLVFIAAGAFSSGCGEDTATVVTVGLVIDCQGGPCDGTTRVGGEHWLDIAAYAENALTSGLRESRVLPGTELRFVVGDSRSDPATAVEEARRLVEAEGAVALVVGSSNDDVAIHREGLGVPLLCVFCSSPDINDPTAIDPDPATQSALRNEDQLNFALGLSANEQALVMLKTAENGLAGTFGDTNGDGVFKITHLASDEAFGRGVGDALEAAALALTPTGCIYVERVYHPVSLDAAHDFALDAACALDEKGTCPPYETADDRLPNGHGRTTVVLGGDCREDPDRAPDLIIESTLPAFAVPLTVAFDRAVLGRRDAPRLHHFTSFRSPTTLPSIAALAPTDAAAFDGAEGVSFVTLERDAVGAPSPADDFDRVFAPVAFQDAMLHDAVAMMGLGALRATVEGGGATPSPASVKAALRSIDEPLGASVLATGQDYARALRLFASGQSIDYDGLSGPCDFDTRWRVRQRMTRFRLERSPSTGALFFRDLEIYNCVAAASCPVTP